MADLPRLPAKEVCNEILGERTLDRERRDVGLDDGHVESALEGHGPHPQQQVAIGER